MEAAISTPEAVHEVQTGLFNTRDVRPSTHQPVQGDGGGEQIRKRGQGKGDKAAFGGEPDTNPVGPADLARTMYRLIGINGDKRIVADGGRPIDIVNGGSLLTDVIA